MERRFPFITMLMIVSLFPLAPVAAQAGDALPNEAPGEADVPARRDQDAVVTVREICIVAPESIDPAWIESLIYVRCGGRASVKELDGLLTRSRRRLEETGHFSRVSVYTLPPAAEDPDARTVVIELSEAFWYGFSFYPWDVSVAFYHLFRADKRLILTLGANTQAATYYDPALGYSPFFILVDAFNTISLQESAYLKDTLGAFVRFGVNLTENIAVYAMAGLYCHFFPDEYFLYPGFTVNLSEAERESRGIARPLLLLREGLGLALDFFKPYDDNRVGVRAGLNASYYHSPDVPEIGYFAVNADLRLFLVPTDWLIITARNILGVHPVHTYGYLQYNVGLVYRGVPLVPLADVFDAVRAEAALRRLLTITPFGLMTIDFLPFLYADFIRSWGNVGDVVFNEIFNGIETCVGGGVHVYLQAPLYLYVTLGAGVSPANGNAFKFFYNITLELY